MERIVTEEVEMKRIVWLMLLIPLLLGACWEPSPYASTEFVGASATATITQTLTPIPPTMTATTTLTAIPTNTFTPTPCPVEVSVGNIVVKQGTALPEVEPITLENLDRLQLLAQWGFGTLYDVQLTADETQVVAATATGFYWFDAITLEVVEYVPYMFDSGYSAIKLSPTTETAAGLDTKNSIVQFVNTADGQSLYSIEDYQALNIYFSPDGNLLYGSYIYQVWNVVDRQWQETELAIPFDEIEFSADGKTFVTKIEGDMYYYPFESYEPEEIEVFGHVYGEEFDLSADGRYIAVEGYEEFNVRVWDMVEEEMVFEHCFAENGCSESISQERSSKQARENQRTGPSSFVGELGFTPNGKYLIISTSEEYGFERDLYRFNLESNILIMKEERIEGGGTLLPFSNSRRYITWSSDSIQSRFIYESGVQAFINKDYNALDLPVEEPLNGYTDFDGIFHVVDNLTDEDIRQKRLDYNYSRFQFFNHSPIIVFGNRLDGTPPILWNYETDEIVSFPTSDWNCYVSILIVSSDDQLIHYCEWEDHCYLVDAATLEMVKLGWWRVVAFHPTDSRLIYWDGEEKRYMVASYNGLTLTPELTLAGCQAIGFINASKGKTLGFLPDDAGYYCSSEERLRIYTNDGEFRDFPITHLSGWNDNYPVGFLDDNSLYITYQLGDLKFFDLTLGRFVTILKTPSAFWEISLIAEDDYILTYSEDRVYRLWGVPAEQ